MRFRLNGRVFLLGLIVGLGFFLRVYKLEFQSLWNDELSSWNDCHFESMAEVIEGSLRKDVHPPGYRLLMWVVVKYFGGSEAVLRWPSVIAGVAVIPMMYSFSKTN